MKAHVNPTAKSQTNRQKIENNLPTASKVIIQGAQHCNNQTKQNTPLSKKSQEETHNKKDKKIQTWP